MDVKDPFEPFELIKIIDKLNAKLQELAEKRLLSAHYEALEALTWQRYEDAREPLKQSEKLGSISLFFVHGHDKSEYGLSGAVIGKNVINIDNDLGKRMQKSYTYVLEENNSGEYTVYTSKSSSIPVPDQKVEEARKAAEAIKSKREPVLSRLEIFSKYINVNHPKSANLIVPFVDDAKDACNRMDPKETQEVFNQCVCEEIARLANKHFHHRHKLMRILVDIIFIPLGIATLGGAFYLKKQLTGSTLFFNAPTNRRKKLDEYLLEPLKKDMKND